MTRKLVVYFRLPSVQHHLVFWADRRQVIHHRRRDDGQGIDTRMMTEGEIVLDPRASPSRSKMCMPID